MSRKREGTVTMISMRESDKPSCGECAHAGMQLEKGEPGRICRRDPPRAQGIAVPAPHGIQVQVITLWPVVQVSDWCAEFCPTPVSSLSN